MTIDWLEYERQRIEDKSLTRNDIAQDYGGLLREHDPRDIDFWRRLNDMIIARWSLSGLKYIKEKAWKS